MAVRLIGESEKEEFDKLAAHPLQSWAWGEFRRQQGHIVVRLGQTQNGKLAQVSQFSLHQIPQLPWMIGYLPRGPMPSDEMVAAVAREARKHRCIFVKFEPNVLVTGNKEQVSRTLLSLELKPGKPMFTPFTFQLDLTKSESGLLAAMKPKTRYNIRLAEKKGVIAEVDNSEAAFAAFQDLTAETTKRQQFLAHSRHYRQLMWDSMKGAGIAKLLVARLGTKVLSTWVIFIFNGVGYYPYGASSDQHREVMASNLLAWHALRLAKKSGCSTFDFWGSLGPNPNPADPWYGFHRFKAGYGARPVEFVGTWDLVLNPWLYTIYTCGDALRWWWLRRFS